MCRTLGNSNIHCCIDLDSTDRVLRKRGLDAGMDNGNEIDRTEFRAVSKAIFSIGWIDRD